jgi:PAS domain S-box-containing protein
VGRVLNRQLESQATTESIQIARISATLLDEHFGQSSAFLESIATRKTFAEALQRDDLALINWHLEKARGLRADFSFISVFDADGTLRAASPPQPGLLHQSFAYRDWYKGVTREWKPYVSEAYRTAFLSRNLVVAIAVPVLDSRGRPIGILMGADALDTISQRLVQNKLEGGWTISVVDQNGHLAARPGINPQSPLVNLSGYAPVSAIRAGKAGNGMSERDGNRFFSRYESVPRYRWGVIVEKPVSALRESVWSVEKHIWLLGLLFLSLGLGLSVFMTSLYSQLETGTQFLNLSIDMFCTAGFDGFFKHLNPAWERVLGFTTEELLSKPRWAFVHPNDYERTAAEAERLRNGGQTVAFENRYLCKDGSYKWLLWNAVSAPGKRLIYAIARDITYRNARNRIERRLLRVWKQRTGSSTSVIVKSNAPPR